MQIDLHPYQLQAFLSKKLIVCCISGIQSGKTFCGSVWARKKISEYTEPDSSFIVAFPTYKIGTSSTIPSFLQHNSQLGHYQKADSLFKLKHGPTVYFRSMENEWSCEGISKCRGIWLDEGGLISDQAWINLTGRASPMQAQIFISSTPYFMHGFYHDLYRSWVDETRDDIDCVQWKSVDNPFFPKEEAERQRKILDPRMFRMRYEGVFEKMSGLVYPDFDHLNLCDAFKIDREKFLVVGGADWGQANPMGIVIRAITRQHQGRYEDYQIAEFKRSGLTADEQINKCLEYQAKYKTDGWVGDSADPGMIALGQSRGLSIVGARKGPDSVAYGIGLHSELIRTKQHKVFRFCQETIREYETYAYAPSTTERPVSEKPIKVNDHLCDGSRYVTMHYRYLYDRSEKVLPPAKTHLQRLLDGEFREVQTVGDGMD